LLPGSAAQSSGRLRIGDVITAIAGRDTPTPAALTEVVRSLLPGEIVDIVVIRDGRATVIHQLLGATGR
jgi:S1-C subfamily serine protease